MAEFKKIKLEVDNDECEIHTDENFDELCKRVTIIADPLVNKKFHKKIIKILKKANDEKMIHVGVKNVQKAIRKNIRGLVFIAGDTTPIDTVSHFPLLCEEKEYPFIFTPSQKELARSFSTQNKACCIALVQPNEQFTKLYDSIEKYITNISSACVY